LLIIAVALGEAYDGDEASPVGLQVT